jgi:hypothetical protein
MSLRCAKQRLTRSRFLPEEDQILHAFVLRFGVNSWTEIASLIPGRNARQCRDRWNHYLAKKDGLWGADNDPLLAEAGQQEDNNWSHMTPFFPEWGDFDLKSHWNDILRAHSPASEEGADPRRPTEPDRGADVGNRSIRVRFPSLGIDPLFPELLVSRSDGGAGP